LQPPKFIEQGEGNKVLKLHKALYGFRYPPAWNSTPNSILHDLGFTRCKAEHGLYTCDKDKHKLTLGFYVVDLIIMGESIKEVSIFKREMKLIFHISDLGSLSYYLGIEVRQHQQGIGLS
jgi:hypothetical protein